MTDSVLKSNFMHFSVRSDPAERSRAKHYLIAALCLTIGVYLSELFHLLEKPLFSKVYYGNLNATFFAVSAAIYIFMIYTLFVFGIKKKFGVVPFAKSPEPMTLSRKAILYVMVVVPVLLTGACLNFRFKLIYELGEKITGMTLLGNGAQYIYAAAKLLAAVYLIFLTERAVDCYFEEHPKLPFGGIAAMLTFGVCDLIFTESVFIWLYLALFLYYGIIYLVSGKRFGITYALALILYIL